MNLTILGHLPERPEREPEYDSTTAVILEKDEETTTSAIQKDTDYDVWTDPLESRKCLSAMSRASDSKMKNEAGKVPEVYSIGRLNETENSLFAQGDSFEQE